VNRAVVRFYNQRGTAEQWIKEGKAATHWTRLSCHRFRANEVRLLLGVIAYNLGNLLRRLILPLAIQSWSLTSLQQRLFKTGGRLIRHARYFVLQLAESYLTASLFRQILGRIERLAWHPSRGCTAEVTWRWSWTSMRQPALILKPDALTTKSAADFKAPERKKLVDQGYTIIVNIGDQMSDLEGGFAERTYKLPNPFYFLP